MMAAMRIRLPAMACGKKPITPSVSWSLIIGLLTLLAVVGCFILPIAVAIGVLSFFEIKTYMELNKPGDHRHLKSRDQLLAILEIATVLFGSVLVVVCGILVLTNINKLDETANT